MTDGWKDLLRKAYEEGELDASEFCSVVVGMVIKDIGYSLPTGTPNIVLAEVALTIADKYGIEVPK